MKTRYLRARGVVLVLVGTLLLLVGAAACSSGDDEAVDLVKDLEVGLEHLYPEAVLVEMKNIQFVPDRIEVNAGEAAQVVLKNSDLSVHTFTIKELEIDHTILFDDEKLVELPALDPGEYTYICTVPGHEFMKGTLVVAEATGGAL